MTSSLYHIEPLTSANYSAWKIKMRWILIDQDLWGYVTGVGKWPEPVDTNSITATEQQGIADWEWKDQQAYVAICLRINDDYMVYTHHTTTSKGVWDALVTIFEASGPIGIINTRHEFFCTFSQESENMEEHVCKLCGLQQTLHMMGELISDCDFSNTLLTSLPKTWSTFIMAVNAGLPTLRSDALITRILEEYQSWLANSGGTVLKGAERDKKLKRYSGTKGKCWNCGKKGHWVKDCWEPGGDKKSQDKPKRNQIIMILHSPAQKAARQWSLEAVGLPTQLQRHI